MMDSTPTRSSSPPTTIQFPVNLHCSHDRHDHDDSPLHPLSSDDNKRTVIGETMDFFAESKTHVDVVKPTKTDDDDLIVNTGLNLLTTNTSIDHSMVVDGISSNMEDKRAKSELEALRAELERIKMENLRLRDMANQVTSNYNTLQMHLVTLMQGQKTSETNEEGGQEKKHGGNGVVPRQFIDLGLAAPGAATAADADELSLSSPEGRSGDRSRSPENNAENGNNKSEEPMIVDEDKKGLDRGIDQREDSPNQGWGHNKITRLNSSKSINQTEATIRKARVSVRARSEAPLVL